MSVKLFDGTLSAAFTPSKPLLITADTVTLDFWLVTSGGPSTVQYYMEFAEDDPNATATRWFRETAEEDSGEGVILMPGVVRTFADSGSAQLADGSHGLSCQFVRRMNFVRVQMRVTAGVSTAQVTAPVGSLAQS